MKLLNRAGSIHRGEGRLVFIMGAVLLINFLAQQISEITAISNFLSTGGVNQILLVWVIDAVMILITMGLQSLVVDRFNRIQLVKWLLLILAGAFVAMRLLVFLHIPDWLDYALLYLLATQQLVFFPVIFWILANDLFDVAQATRLFPLITSLGFGGRLLGIGIAAVAPALLVAFSIHAQELLILNAVLYLLAFFLISSLGNVHLRQVAQPHENVRETLTEGWSFVREVPAFRFLAVSIIALLICDAVIEFRFLTVSDAAYPDPINYQTFYSLYRLGLTIISILVQGLVTGWIFTKIALKNSFLVKSVSVLVGSLLMLLVGGLPGALAGVVLLRISQYSVDEPARKAFQSLVPEERRGRVSIFIESYLYFIGTLLGCGITGFIVFAGVFFKIPQVYMIYLGVSAIAAVFATWAILNMIKVYDASLLNWRLKRRQRGKSLLDKMEF